VCALCARSRCVNLRRLNATSEVCPPPPLPPLHKGGKGRRSQEGEKKGARKRGKERRSQEGERKALTRGGKKCAHKRGKEMRSQEGGKEMRSRGCRLAGPRSEPEPVAQNGLHHGTKPHRRPIGSIPKHGATGIKGRAGDANRVMSDASREQSRISRHRRKPFSGSDLCAPVTRVTRVTRNRGPFLGGGCGGLPRRRWRDAYPH
jgi:hypothetical protein